MLLKLLMDFYGDDMVARAKSVLLENVIVPDDDEAKRSRKGLNKKLNSMKDSRKIDPTHSHWVSTSSVTYH